jgi:hypothetical protein
MELEEKLFKEDFVKKAEASPEKSPTKGGAKAVVKKGTASPQKAKGTP